LRKYYKLAAESLDIYYLIFGTQDPYTSLISKITIMKESMVFFSISNLKIMTAQHLLESEGIKSFTVNKMDSAHAGLFGEIELYIPKEDEERARVILFDSEIL